MERFRDLQVQIYLHGIYCKECKVIPGNPYSPLLSHRMDHKVDCPKLEEYFEEYYELFDYRNQAKRHETVIAFRKEIRKSVVAPLKDVCLTISPADHETPSMCIAIVEELKKLVPFKFSSFDYVYEQRAGPEEPTKGWHIHAFLKDVTDHRHVGSVIRDHLKKKKDGLGLNPKTDFIIRTVAAWNNDFRDKYMHGKKGLADPVKILHSAGDKIHRLAFNLENFYSFPIL